MRLWDVTSGREIFSHKEQASAICSVTFSPNGYQIAFGCGNGTLKFWDVPNGRDVAIVESPYSWNSATFNMDNRLLALGNNGSVITIWNKLTGQKIYTLKGSPGWVSRISFSPDGRKLAYASSNNTLKIWDLAGGQEIRTLKGHSGSLNCVAFSPDGYKLASGSYDGTLKLWNVASGEEIRTFKRDSDSVSSISFSPDGRQLASVSECIKLWNVTSGQEIRSFKKSGDVECVAFSPDGYKLASGSYDGTLKLWDVVSGQEIYTVKGHSNSVSFVTFSPSGRELASASLDRTAKLWDVASGQEIHTFGGFSGWVYSIAFSPDGRQLASASEDKIAKLWDVKTSKEICQFVSFPDGNWVAITPEGYFNSSPGGEKYINVRTGPTSVAGVNQYRSTFYRPDIVEAALQGKDTSPLIAANKPGTQPKPANISDAAKFPPPVVVIATPEDGTIISEKQTQIRVVVKDKAPLKKIELFVNGKAVLPPQERAVVRKKTSTSKTNRSFPVELDPGENTVIVRAHNSYAFGEDRIILHRKKKTNETALLPRLFILAVGAGDYPYLDNNLSYTASDAKDFAAAFAPMKDRLFREIHTKVLTSDSSIKPTSANIEDNLNFLAQASQHDVAILFLAGHGIRDNRGRYYFLPEDAKRNDNGDFRRSTMIRWSDIQEAMDIPATMIAFIDTCHSGSFFKSGKVRAVDNNRVIRELLEQGTIVFASSSGSEYSVENNQWGHGAFTYAILQGLQKERANSYKDDRITWKELDSFVSNEVVKITNNAQHPVSYIPDGGKDFTLWLTK